MRSERRRAEACVDESAHHAGTREEPGTLTQGAPVFPGSSVCVFITVGPFTKLCAWGRRRVEDMCYEIRRAEACVD